jgi:hypothetical protein
MALPPNLMVVPAVTYEYLFCLPLAQHKKLKLETQIGDARKGDHLRSGKMRRARINEDQNWLGGG